MYSPDRAKQIKFTKEKLKNDGIIGFIEKFSNKDITEFLKRECVNRHEQLSCNNRYI